MLNNKYLINHFNFFSTKLYNIKNLINNMNCELCDAVKETKHSFCTICKWPIKNGHIIIMPKRHVTQDSITKLNEKELKDFNNLIQEMENLMNEKFSEDIITFKNSGKHSTQVHLHYHLLPSKGGLRDLISTYENISKRDEIPKEKYKEMKNFLIK